MQNYSEKLLYQIRGAFALPILTVHNIFKVNDLSQALAELNLENQSLRAELLARSLDMPKIKANLFVAKVSASYPYNNKSAITIAGGAGDGLAPDMPVLAAPGIFLGQITKVGKNWSEVRTVFDNSWELPVRVGLSGTAGLLRGGASLVVGLIDKIKIVANGDAVYTATKDIPYGLKIGDVKMVRDNTGTAFKEADVLAPYSLGELYQVFVILD